MNQRWLSLAGICELLSTTETNINWLVKNGFLEKLPGNSGKHSARYLEPTEEYARRLKICETVYNRRFHIPSESDLPGAAMFTHREIAEIMGWTLQRTYKYVTKRKVSSVSGGGNKVRLFTARQIRNIIWKRQGRQKAYKRAPYLLPELIEYFLRFEAAQRELVPTDAEFAEDDKMLKKWELLARMDPADRELAMQEFLEKVRIAREIVTAAREDRRSD